jgi:hypothetical protein
MQQVPGIAHSMAPNPNQADANRFLAHLICLYTVRFADGTPLIDVDRRS